MLDTATPTAAPSPAAPTTTAPITTVAPSASTIDRTPVEAIALSTIERLEAADRDAEADADVDVEAEAPPTVAIAPPVDTTKSQSDLPRVDPDDFDGLPSEVVDSMGRKRENRLPHSRVQRIVENARTKVAAEYEVKLAEATQRVQAHEQHISQMAQVEQVMQSDPEAFLSMMAQIDPRYARFIESAQNGASRHGSNDAGMPQPDVRLHDGSSTYSLEGLQARDEWRDAQLEARIAKRYAPVEQTVGKWQEQQRQQALFQHAQKAVQSTLTDARTWPGFTDNEPAILKALQDNPKTSLEGAYRTVTYPKLTASREQMRKDVLAEIQGRPTSTSAPTSTTGTSQAAKAKTTEQIARDVISRLEGGR